MTLLELLSGTGSMGKAFRELDWKVVSLDVLPLFHPTICENILTWDYTAFPPDYFDCVHMSPPCEQYSTARTTAKTPRNLDLADSLVLRCRTILDYFKPRVWIMENPATSMLSGRDFMRDLVEYRRVVSYCKYGALFRKDTAIWSNLGHLWQPLPPCRKATPCTHMVGNRHTLTAQRGPGKQDGVRRAQDNCSVHVLHAIPSHLCFELALAATYAICISPRDRGWGDA